MEDIDYLRANSERVSYMFYVDSNQRDKTLYPNPNQYAIQFTSPFKNVYAIEVVDASIPRTQYNVEMDTNTLVYEIDGTNKTIRIDIGDYTADTLIYELNSKLSPDEIIVEHLSSPSEKRKQFLFHSNHAFSFLIHRSTLGNVLGFNQPVPKQSTDIDRYTYHAKDDSSMYPLVSILDRVQVTNYIIKLHGHDILKQRMTCKQQGYLHELTFTVMNASVAFELTVSVRDENNQSLFKTTVNVEPSVHQQYTISCESTFVMPGTHVIQMHVSQYAHNDQIPMFEMYTNMTNDSTNVLLINDQPAYAHTIRGTQTTIGTLVYQLDPSTSFDITLQCAFTMYIPRFTLIPPGIYNLIGDRYVILKCKEVESNMLASAKSFDVRNENGDIKEESFDFGLAKFKMGVVGFSEERFDFNRLPPQEFHPIGKLYMMTFRFETSKKKLYDFKGVDHTLTLIIRYYMPKMSYQERAQSQFLLNTEYTPNMIEYEAKHRHLMPHDPSIQYQFDEY